MCSKTFAAAALTCHKNKSSHARHNMQEVCRTVTVSITSKNVMIQHNKSKYCSCCCCDWQGYNLTITKSKRSFIIILILILITIWHSPGPAPPGLSSPFSTDPHAQRVPTKIIYLSAYRLTLSFTYYVRLRLRTTIHIVASPSHSSISGSIFLYFFLCWNNNIFI